MWNVIGEISRDTRLTMGENLPLDAALDFYHTLKHAATAAAQSMRITRHFSLITYWIEPAGEIIVLDRQPVPNLNKEAALIH